MRTLRPRHQGHELVELVVRGTVTKSPLPDYQNGSVTLTLWEDPYRDLRNSTAYTFCHCRGA